MENKNTTGQAPGNAGATFPTVETVKTFIISKFKKFSRFAELAGIEHPDVLHNLFKKQPGQHLADIYEKAKNIPNGPRNKEITDSDRANLENYIKTQYGGNVNRFARTEGVDYPTTHKILKNNIHTKTALVKMVLQAVK